MKEKLLRLARFNQKWLGMALLILIYFVGLGPVALARKATRLFGLNPETGGGWQKAAKVSLTLKKLEEQS